MTGPGPRPPRGRHAAPDDDARPEEAGAGGRHAAGDPAGRRDPEVPGPPGPAGLPGISEPPSRRRHAAPDDSPTGVTYHRPSLSNGLPYRRPGPNGHAPSGYPPPTANGYRPPGTGEGYPNSTADTTAHGPLPDGFAGPRGPGQDPPEPGPDGFAGPRGPAQDRPEPVPGGYASFGYHRPTPPGNDPAFRYTRPETAGSRYHQPAPEAHNPAIGYRPLGPGADNPAVGYRPLGPGADNPAVGYRPEAGPGDSRFGSRPSERAAGVGYGASEPGAGEPGSGYHRPEPGAHRYGRTDAAPHPWTGTNGYHLETPGPPGVNGYRLDEPLVPVNGFPYTAPPSTPIAYPVNGHGVDAAERDAASWPARGNTVWPVDVGGPGLDQPLDPRAAGMPLEDEPTEILDRPKAQPAAAPRKPPHPPRAVARRRRARRKALEWPFLIVFALLSAFLIRHYVVQTFFIPSASMHETLVEGDRVLVNKVGYHLHDIHRGDVVVFAKPPNLNVNEDDLIKRVIGLPGETVEGRDGKVFINGAPLQEPYVEPLCHGTGEFPKVTVPAGKLWVMGDNRCNSSDSRVFGPIDQHLVVGRAFVLVWPLDRLAWL